MAELDTLTQERLAEQLLAFGQAPGRFAVHLGEPSLVHHQMDTVVAWALGRTPDDWAERAEALKDAAVLFVLRSCFAAHNNLYQVLGLRNRAVEPSALKSRYRALIRLAHPDMNVKGLPANASALVNRAYEVLGDPDARSRYDAELDNSGMGLPVRPPGDYRPVARYKAELQAKAGWAERWHALTARHPKLLRHGLVGLIVVLVSCALIWLAASDGSESRMLIASDMRVTSNRKAVVPEVTQAKDLRAGENLPRPHGKPPVVAKREAASAPAASKLPTFEPLPGRPALMAAAGQNAPQTKTTVATPTAATATSPAPVPPVAGQALAAPEATTATTPAAQTWPVDAASAKQLMTSVLNALESTVMMQQVQGQLESSKVRGSLMRAALQRLKGTTATIDRMGWTETPKPGGLQMQGYVELTLDGAERAGASRARFGVSADFVGTRDGAGLVALSLKDETPVAVAPGPEPNRASPTPPPAAAAATAQAAAPVQLAPAVDANRARELLNAVFKSLEMPRYSRQIASHLASENVKGTLLAPVHHRLGDTKATVERATWTGTPKPGGLVLQGPVVLVTEGQDGVGGLRLRFAVNAEFVATREGTALAALNLKDETPPPSLLPSATSAQPPVASAPAAEVEQPRPVTWPVDANKAKELLNAIFKSLESPRYGYQVTKHLAKENVKGNLLGPVQQRSGDEKVTVESAAWTVSPKPGTLLLQGPVVLVIEGQAGAGTRLRYAVSAEFVGTKEGTAISALNLKEMP